MKSPLSRRNFLGAAAGAALTLPAARGRAASASARPGPANAGGMEWPVTDGSDEQALLDVLRSGKWGRTAAPDGRVKQFEAAFAARMQARYCIATSSGTTALLSTLGALNLGPGDEVLLPPYTFIATFNAITMNYALPVFVDIDPATFQINPKKIAAALTRSTRLLLPVHIGGSACDLEGVLEAAAPRKIPVIEDACQAPFAEWRGRPVGTQGLAGCFSFQASKNLTSGEGGAVLTNDEAFAHQVFNFHTPGTPRPAGPTGRGANFRLTEFQAGLLLTQLQRAEAQYRRREENAAHLTALLEKIPGIAPARLTPGNNRSAWHLYMLRYDRQAFAGMSRAKFIQALADAGVPASAGYSSLNTAPAVTALATNPQYLRIYGKDGMTRWLERNRCPANDALVQEAVWFSQHRLLGPRSEMERIAEAIAGIQKRAGQLARS